MAQSCLKKVFAILFVSYSFVQVSLFCAVKVPPQNKESAVELKKAEQDLEKCTICLDKLSLDEKENKELPCSIETKKQNHKFHTACIDGWLKEGNLTCPLCRSLL